MIQNFLHFLVHLHVQCALYMFNPRFESERMLVSKAWAFQYVNGDYLFIRSPRDFVMFSNVQDLCLFW